jgi:hypothetical protein
MHPQHYQKRVDSIADAGTNNEMIIEERTLITVGWDRMMYSLEEDLEGYQPLWRSAVLCGNRVSGMMMKI